jgi:dTDP-4-dehydrorhamnose reductase
VRIVIVGAKGQLGQALCKAAYARPSFDVVSWQRPEIDITSPGIADQIAQTRPDVVINAAAWTHVDAAETEPDAAYAANALGPKYIAEGCRACGAAMVQVSTNEVFAGDMDRDYREYDLPQPGGVYARSKLAGEIAARQIWERLYIVRVAWLFGRGTGDFPAKILAAAANRDALRIVADEYGNPTYAPHAAQGILRLVESGHYGIYHLVSEGKASRYEWAARLFARLGRTITLTPITASEWPRPVTPPSHAVLVNQAGAALGIRLPTWQEALEEYLKAGALTTI